MRRALVATALGIFATIAAWAAPGGPDEPVPAETALTELKQGNQRFVEGKPSFPRGNAWKRVRAHQGQSPHTVVLSCSDSQIPPEELFDQDFGKIFNIRVAGNAMSAATVASIEYAIERLGARLLVVLGHEACRTVATAIRAGKELSKSSPELKQLLTSIRAHAGSRKPASEDEKLREPVRRHVAHVAAQLRERSRLIRKHVEDGSLTIIPGIFGIDDGRVDFWDLRSPASARKR